MIFALPSTNRRGMVRSFGVVIGFLAGAVLAGAGTALHQLWVCWLGMALGLWLGLLGFYRESLLWKIYWKWNHLLVRPITAVCREVVIRVCYFIVFVAVGRSGSRLRLYAEVGRESFWTTRDSLDTEVEASGLSFRRGKGNVFNWITDYLRWAFRSGNCWAVALLPFLLLIRWLARPRE